MATTETGPVHESNVEQLRAWDGQEGAYWAAHADHFERALEGYRDPVFRAASVLRTDAVLDIGCGTGRTARDAARLACDGSVLGVDLSSAMLDVARARAAADGLANLHFEQADAQIHRFAPEHFDVALGQTSAMFFGDRVAALANVGRALRPGGHLVLLTWQPLDANEWIRELSTALAAGREIPAPPSDAPGPFSLADPDVIRSVLAGAGYVDATVDPVTAPMWFGHDAGDAFELLSGLMAWMLDGLDDEARAGALANLRATLRTHEAADGVRYGSAAWLTRAVRA
jgi:SAM-dependent methyltransferase